MNKAQELYNSWITNPKYGFFWYPHITPSYSKEEIESMSTTQLKYLIKKTNAYKKSLDYTNNQSVNELFLDGWECVNKILDELENNYYYHILNTDVKFKNTNHTIVDVPDFYIYEKEEKFTFRKICATAQLIVIKDYKKKCKKNIKELLTICDVINLKKLLITKTDNQEIVNNLNKLERDKHYEAIRLIKNPEKENKRKELGLLRLKEWKETDPEGYAESHRQSVKKYQKKQKDLTTCETTEELAAKVVKIAIAKALKNVYNANYHKLKQELKKLK